MSAPASSLARSRNARPGCRYNRNDLTGLSQPLPVPRVVTFTRVGTMAAGTAHSPQPSGRPPVATSILATVALVNKVVDTAGGIDQVRQVAEAVRSCGGVEGFLRHLELVAGIRGGA